MKFNIKLKKVREDLYLASCTNLPGCHIQAESRAEAERMIKSAIQAYLKSYKQHHEKLI